MTFGSEKTRMVCLSDGETNVKICLFISTEFTNYMTGRQTGGRTDGRHVGSAFMHSVARKNRDCPP